MSRLPVLKGTLDILVLRALSWTPMHGTDCTATPTMFSRLAKRSSALAPTFARLMAAFEPPPGALL